MRKLTLALLAALAIVILGVACGDDDDGNGDTTPTGTGTPSTAEPTSTEEPEATPTENGDKTPSNSTPVEETPAPTEAGPQPTPAAEGTPATAIENPTAFFEANYPGTTFAQSECGFSPVTYIVTCGADKYAPNPPLTGQDVQCSLLSDGSEPVAIHCRSQEPLQSIYYDIQE